MKKQFKNITTENSIIEINQIIDRISPEDKAAIIPKITEYLGNSIIKDSFTDFFKQNPNVETFSWIQYTPSWNDGDACTFRACFDDLIEINGINGDELPEESLEVLEADLNFLNKDLEEFTLKIKEYEIKELENQNNNKPRDKVSIMIKNKLNKNKEATKKLINVKNNQIKKASLNPKLFDQISDLLEKSGIENIAEQCFGTNVRVICHSDGTISTDEYDCGY